MRSKASRHVSESSVILVVCLFLSPCEATVYALLGSATVIGKGLVVPGRLSQDGGGDEAFAVEEGRHTSRGLLPVQQTGLKAAIAGRMALQR